MEIKGLDTAFEKKLLSNAKKKCKTIVLPEAGINEQVMLAGLTCAENKIAKIVMLVSDNKLLEKYNAEAVFVDEDKNVYLTDGIKDRFELMKNTYTVKDAE